MKEFLSGCMTFHKALMKLKVFFEHEEKDFYKYKKNMMLKRAIERNL